MAGIDANPATGFRERPQAVIAVTMTVQPTATGTWARFVHTTVGPPSLVIDDGTTTLVLRPAEGTDGAAAAAELAQELVQVASEWESGCRRALAATQPEDRFDSDAPLLLSPEQLQGLSEAVKRRVLMALATKAVVGEAVLGEVIKVERLAPMLTDAAPLPARIGKGDVAALRALTDRFRLLGRTGHAGMPDVLIPVAMQRERLLTVAADDNVLRQLQSALAKLHTLTGWWCDDRHLIDTASWHDDRAIRLAGEAGDVIQMVDAAAHAAIGYRELGIANDALKLYQLAQAKLSGLPDAYPGKSEHQAVLHARTAHAYADLGWSEQAHRELEWARQVPSLADPFENAEMDAKLAAIELAVGNLDVAEQNAARSVAAMPAGAQCQSALGHIRLALIHARTGQSDTPKLTIAALDAVKALRSVRVRAQLAPLEDALRARRGSTFMDLAEQARRVRQAKTK